MSFEVEDLQLESRVLADSLRLSELLGLIKG